MNGIIIHRLVRSIEDNNIDQSNATKNQWLCEQIYEGNTDLQNKSLLYCPPFHDGATCWPPVLAGTTAYMPCPSSYEGQMYNSNENASKKCLESGNWSSQSNYSPCVLTSNSSTIEVTMALRCIFLTGYSVSCGCLCLALVIFYIFKSLKCMRNTIHSHLFVALMIKACAWSISYIFVEFTDIEQFTGNTRSTINSLLNITISLQAFGSLAIFVWMFIEGLYLCLIVYCAFWVEKMRFWPCALIGWGLPTVLISIRALINFIKYPTEFWLFHGIDIYLLTIPTLILLGLNVIFLIAILYALNDKLRKRVIVTNTHSVTNNLSRDSDSQLPQQQPQKRDCRRLTNLFTDDYEDYTSIDDDSALQPLPNLDDYPGGGFVSLTNKRNPSYYHSHLSPTRRKSLSFRGRSKLTSSNYQDTTATNTNSSGSKRNNVNNNKNIDRPDMNQLYIPRHKRRFQSLPNATSSSVVAAAAVATITETYDEQNLADGFYQKSPNQLTLMNAMSRDASCRSSQVSDISRFELPGTTRIRLAKLIGRISGQEFVKTVKASLTLMPLLGIPEIIFITPYHPYLKPAFDIINAFLTSTQVRRQFEKRLRTRSLRTSLYPHRRSTRMNKRLSS
uniref:G_PROTEIN_RECEP_F2_4 domain-containing protein n=1 Tax=Trichobilharzia regenti TaxID=157069 RepID=A0AA85J6I7_TRIRE|nr:unnamed protein product [Trichobilharzia regenti]